MWRAGSFGEFAGLSPFLLALLAAPLGALPSSAFDFFEPVELVCTTRAVNLDTSPFQSSQGEIRLKLTPLEGAQADKGGTLTVVTHDDKHAASFTIEAAGKCVSGCPLTVGDGSDIQLWMPKPKALTQLTDEETLVLVSVDRKSMELKASAFRKKQLAGLERGECKVSQEVPDAPATDEKAATQPAPAPEGQAGAKPSEP